jgi:hypothetical protein
MDGAVGGVLIKAKGAGSNPGLHVECPHSRNTVLLIFALIDPHMCCCAFMNINKSARESCKSGPKSPLFSRLGLFSGEEKVKRRIFVAR